MVEADLLDFFFRLKPAKVIVALGDPKTEWFASSLAKEVNCTFPHMIKILSKFRDFGLVSFKTNGRRKLVFLTPKGRRLAQDFSRIVAVFRG